MEIVFWGGAGWKTGGSATDDGDDASLDSFGTGTRGRPDGDDAAPSRNEDDDVVVLGTRGSAALDAAELFFVNC